MKVHICLMSDQLLANYLPAKQLKPDYVLLVNTQYTLTKKLDERITALLELQSIKVGNAPKVAPDDSYALLLNYFTELAQFVKTQSWSNVTLNITGGTKLMSLAAFEAFKENCQQIIYVNTHNDQIQYVLQDEFIKLKPDLIGVDEYLFAHNVFSAQRDVATEEWVKQAEARKLLTQKLADFARDSQKAGFIGALNYEASKSLKKNRLPDNSYETLLTAPEREFRFIFSSASRLLESCEDFGLLTYHGGKKITISSVEAAEYLSGLWLEEYCYLLGKKLGLHDVRCSQEISWNVKTEDAEEVRNEIDVLFVHNNRMLIIECKTANFDRDFSSSNDIIYKLDSIATDLRGLFGKIWLLSAREINDQRIIKRAESQHINLLHGEQLANLESEIKKWAKI